jgi:PST family polysaccharide transporter
VSLKKELSTGVAYNAISKYSGIIVSLIVSAVLARLISPEDFGVIAVAMVIITFFSVFSDLGIAPAIIQNKSLSKENLSDIFSFTFWLGLALSLVFFFSSWVIASYYNMNKLIHICQILSINLFFVTVNIVPSALLYKNKEFKFIAFRAFSVQFSGGLISIIAALNGAGLYALLINPIFSSITLFIVNILRYPQKMKFIFNLSSLKIIFSYSSYQFLFNLINYFSRNLDKLLIGKYMGMSLLGYYEKSYRLMMLPLQNITYAITPVMHPIFSNFQDDLHKLSVSYMKVVRLLAFVGLPLSVLLWFTSREAVLIVFGDQWINSIPVFQILSLSVGIQIILSTSGSIFQAANATKLLFISGLLSSILNVSGILIGIFIFDSLIAVAWCITITFTINFVQCYYIMYRYILKTSAIDFIKQFKSPIILCIILFSILLLISHLIILQNILASALLKGLAFIVTYGLYIQMTKELDIYGKLKNKIK